MLALIQRCLTILTTALLLGYATTASASSPDADRQLADALEQALPSLISSGDFRSASKLYFQLATARNRLKETAAVCTALSQSLAYYRKALVKDTAQPDQAAADASNDSQLRDAAH